MPIGTAGRGITGGATALPAASRVFIGQQALPRTLPEVLATKPDKNAEPDRPECPACHADRPALPFARDLKKAAKHGPSRTGTPEKSLNSGPAPAPDG